MKGISLTQHQNYQNFNMKRYIQTIFFIILIILFNCKTNTNKDRNIKKSNLILDSIRINKKTNKDSKIDSLNIGVQFYKYSSFKNYRFIEAEPYEMIAVDKNINSTQIVIYKRDKLFYIVLLVAEGLVDNFDYDWEKINKRIADIKTCDSSYNFCWYPNVKDDSGGFGGLGKFGVGNKKIVSKNLDEYEMFFDAKIWVADYLNGKIKDYKLDKNEFNCVDDY